MRLQFSDPAAVALERLRLEVALLRRALEGLSAAAEPVDYSPALAGLSDAITALEGRRRSAWRPEASVASWRIGEAAFAYPVTRLRPISSFITSLLPP